VSPPFSYILWFLADPARSAEAFAVRIAVSKGARTKNMGNATVGEKRSASSLEPSSDSSSDSDDEYADAEGTFDESLYAEGEHPDELREQQRRLRRARGEDTSTGMQGKMVKTRKGDRDVKKPMSEKERKKAEGKEAKRKRDAMIGCVRLPGWFKECSLMGLQQVYKAHAGRHRRLCRLVGMHRTVRSHPYSRRTAPNPSAARSPLLVPSHPTSHASRSPAQSLRPSSSHPLSFPHGSGTAPRASCLGSCFSGSRLWSAGLRGL
jgi:hypothetical protein